MFCFAFLFKEKQLIELKKKKDNKAYLDHVRQDSDMKMKGP